MSGNHNTKSNDEERLLNADTMVSMHEFLCMKQTAESYKELMDATAKDADRAYELLRRCETEMRYAGWTKVESDNPARNEVYEDVKEFLK